ncbi:MAG: STAS domain-containing protein [Deltaproteobacteria bacterium]|nr:STAS domain-containing protein [Deltaproteobacteria bacterium]
MTSQIETTKVGASTVVTPRESLTYKNCEEFQNIVSALIGQHQHQIIIDGRAMALMDSKALETLLYLHDRLKERGGVLKIAALNAVCRDILIATRFINTFHIYQDIQEAIRMGT